jgi:cytochrome c peroxidase
MIRLRTAVPGTLFLAFAALTVLGMVLAGANEMADASEPGKSLFHQRNLGPGGKSCADCHRPEEGLHCRLVGESLLEKVASCHANRQGSGTPPSDEVTDALGAYVLGLARQSD